MNAVLLSSSIIVSLFLFIIYLFCHNNLLQILYFTTLIGSITSILNHGISNKILKYLDRFTIATSAIVYISFIILLSPIEMYLSLIFITNAISFYFISKLTKKCMYHLMAHFLIVPLFFLLH